MFRVAAALWLFAAVPAWAGACGHATCWGAVGVGPNGAWGFSHSFPSETGAVGRVRSECPGCTVIETFYNTCGAIAVATNGQYGFGWGGSRAAAESTALGYCRGVGPGCSVQVWSCSP